MIQLRERERRGYTHIAWLDSYHTFSFGDYYDPVHMGFGDLRVINDDRVQPKTGFGLHPHRDMEIVTYVLSGQLQHEDSMGNGSVIRAGDVQLMSAGTGIRHSEFNPSPTEVAHFLQIWILPEKKGMPPSYEQRHVCQYDKRGKLCLMASPDGRNGSVTIHQDVNLYVSQLGALDIVTYNPPSNRKTWIQVAKGAVLVNGQPMEAGDGLGADEATGLTIGGLNEDAEVLVFDLRA